MKQTSIARILRYAALFVIVAAAVVYAQSSKRPKGVVERKRTDEIRTALSTGKPVVLLVFDSTGKRSGEAYADWAEYLNQFSSRERNRVVIVRLTPHRYGQLVTTPQLTGAYNTLFLRDSTHAMLYRGMIVEPQVYSIGTSFATGKAGAQVGKWDGLDNATVQLRR